VWRGRMTFLVAGLSIVPPTLCDPPWVCATVRSARGSGSPGSRSPSPLPPPGPARRELLCILPGIPRTLARSARSPGCARAVHLALRSAHRAQVCGRRHSARPSLIVGAAGCPARRRAAGLAECRAFCLARRFAFCLRWPGRPGRRPWSTQAYCA